MVCLQRPATVRTLHLNGGLRRFWDFPPTDSGPSAAPLFMVHGFRGDHHGLLRIVEALPRHRVIVPDLPGFGQSGEFRGRHDVCAYSGFVLASVRKLGLGPDTVLVGHSFGSIIAAASAAEAPGAFAALVLINPISTPALEGTGRIATRLAELYYRTAAKLPEQAGQALLSNRLIVRVMSEMMAKTRDPSLRRWIHGQHRSYFSAFASRDVVLQAFTASISATVRDSAPRLKLPVLLIAAENDDLGTVATQQSLNELIPDSRLVVLPGVGHLIHYEMPDDAARLIADFADKQRPAARTLEEKTQ